jgi:hypothetical protein
MLAKELVNHRRQKSYLDCLVSNTATSDQGRDSQKFLQSCRVSPRFGTTVQHFRAYIIGENGHIVSAVDLICEHEGAAKERAQQLVNGSDVELWQAGRMIAVFESLKDHTVIRSVIPLTPDDDA